MSDEALAKALQPVAAAIVTLEEARRARAVDSALTDDGKVRGSKVRGRVRPHVVGVVDQRSVRVGDETLEDRLDGIDEAIGTAAAADGLAHSLLLGGM